MIPIIIRTLVQFLRIKELRFSSCEKREEIGLKSEEYYLILFLSPRVETRGNWNVRCLNVRRVKTLLKRRG
jgi:hypothetical protein